MKPPFTYRTLVLSLAMVGWAYATSWEAMAAQASESDQVTASESQKFMLAFLQNPARVERPEEKFIVGRPYRLAGEAYRALQAGNLVEAEINVNRALALRPDSKQLNMLSFDILLRKEDWAAAKLRADYLVSHFDMDAQFWANKGYVLQKLKEHLAAVTTFKVALNRKPMDTKQRRVVRLALADSAIVIKSGQQALAALMPIASPKSYEVQIRIAQAEFMLNHFDAARVAAEQAASLSSSSADLSFAQRFIKTTKLQIVAAEPVVVIPPKPVQEALLDKAYRLVVAHKDKEALPIFQQAFESGKGTAMAYADAGYVARRLNQNDLAIDFLKTALSQMPPLSDEIEREVRLALADVGFILHKPEDALEYLALVGSSESYAVQIRLAQAHMMMGRKSWAEDEATQADILATNEAEHAEAQRQLKVIRSVTGNTPLKYTDEAMRSSYELLYAHKDKEALASFTQSFASGQGNAVNYIDAGYAAKRIRKNKIAVDLFEQGLALNQAESEGTKSFNANEIFAYEREIQELRRNWGFLVNVTKQQAPPIAGRTRTDNVAGGMDIYWQPYYDNGRLAQVYVSSFETLLDYTGVNGAGVARVKTGMQSNLTGVGVRYKPLSEYGLILAAERQVTAPNGTSSEPLLRVGYSTDRGTDIKPIDRDWSTFQFYAAATYYLANHQRHIVNAEGTYGHSFHFNRLSDRLVIYPHYGITAYFDSNINANTVANPLIGAGVVPPAGRESWGYGPGVKFRYWLPEHGRFAAASVMDVNIQYHYHKGPGANVQIGQGWLLNASFWY